jgi:hypothetical protein
MDLCSERVDLFYPDCRISLTGLVGFVSRSLHGSRFRSVSGEYGFEHRVVPDVQDTLPVPEGEGAPIVLRVILIFCLHVNTPTLYRAQMYVLHA